MISCKVLHILLYTGKFILIGGFANVDLSMWPRALVIHQLQKVTHCQIILKGLATHVEAPGARVLVKESLPAFKRICAAEHEIESRGDSPSCRESLGLQHVQAHQELGSRLVVRRGGALR